MNPNTPKALHRNPQDKESLTQKQHRENHKVNPRTNQRTHAHYYSDDNITLYIISDTKNSTWHHHRELLMIRRLSFKQHILLMKR